MRGITAGPDGNLWFTEYKGAKIGQITTAGVITEFPIPGNRQSQPPSIAAGPDANLWFTMQYNNQVGRITDAPVPAASLSPNSGPPGTAVQASGSGYGSFETVVLTFVDSGTVLSDREALPGLWVVEKFDVVGKGASDGELREAKEMVGGYWLIQAKSKEEAVEWAKRCPAADGDVIEVRQVFEMSDFPPEVQEAAR